MKDRISVESVLSQIRAMQDMVASRAASPSLQAPAKSDFAQMLKASVEQVNGAQHQATKLAQSFERGDQNVNLQDVMISMQKANISFQTMVQVRNRVVSAYQDIMNMPV
jgi:flagellar hook-basal body complex protein FliE